MTTQCSTGSTRTQKKIINKLLYNHHRVKKNYSFPRAKQRKESLVRTSDLWLSQIRLPQLLFFFLAHRRAVWPGITVHHGFHIQNTVLLFLRSIIFGILLAKLAIVYELL